MTSLRYTRDLFLRVFCVVYLSAFLSFYIQIPGLYGDNGVLPAKSVLENSKHKTLSAKIHYQPTLLWLAPYLGLDTNYALDLLALLGAFLSFTGLVSTKFCISPVFTALWSLYFSLYQVGQTFVSQGFDELLLEAGVLAIFVCPFLPLRRGSRGRNINDFISFWLLRWLLFRFLLTTGLKKFTSECPKWWTLTALSHHFETMPLPAPLAWYSHYLPLWSLKLTEVYVHVCEIILPFLFLIPIRYVRITAFVAHIFLQMCIVLTGNFEFVNVLIAVLLLSLLDDEFFYGRKKPNSKWAILGKTLNVAIYAVVVYGVIQLFSLKLNGSIIESRITFLKSQFDEVLSFGLTYTIHLGLLTLAATVLYCLSQTLFDNTGNKALGVVGTLLYSCIALTIFFASTVPLASLHKASNSTIHPMVRTYYNRLHKTRAVNEYGFYGKMQGLDGRREIVLEGADSLEGQWKEYNFLYKPGNVNHSLPYLTPYAPKLDWQMHWAAYSTYEKQPWLLSLAHRLLIGRQEALNLLDKQHSPFSQKPPKYIRGVLYKYKFTPWNQRSQASWWVRERTTEYFPAFTKDSPTLIEFLKARNLLPTTTTKEEVNPLWKQILDSIRYVTNHLEATLVFWAVFTAGLAIIVTNSKK